MENPADTRELPEPALAELRKGSKIGAIKIVREQWSLGLKEAKDLVDAYIESRPELQKAMWEAQAGARSALLKWLVVIALLAAAAYYFLAGK